MWTKMMRCTRGGTRGCDDHMLYMDLGECLIIPIGMQFAKD